MPATLARLFSYALGYGLVLSSSYCLVDCVADVIAPVHIDNWLLGCHLLPLSLLLRGGRKKKRRSTSCPQTCVAAVFVATPKDFRGSQKDP